MSIRLLPITMTDIPLMHRWFNQSHVQKYYSLRNWTVEEVHQKLKLNIMGEKPIFGFIATIHHLPLGYCQFYRLQDFPFEKANLPIEIINNAAGVDLFIGEEKLLARGLGQMLTQEFLQQVIWLQYEYCVIDPDCRNSVAIHCYEKVGFKKLQTINTVDALKRTTQLQLMIYHHEQEYK